MCHFSCDNPKMFTATENEINMVWVSELNMYDVVSLKIQFVHTSEIERYC